ncbi:hypothetical protein DDN72_17680 [Vibrio cholerae]|nr:hypothetical protein [Vibrio cholerae]
MTSKTLGTYINTVSWKADLASLKRVRDQARNLKKELLGTFNDLPSKNKVSKQVNEIKQSFDKAGHAARQTQKVMDKSFHLTGQQSEALKKKLDNLNDQFTKGKMDTKAYNYEISRTAKYYGQLSKEAAKAERDTARLHKQQEKLNREKRLEAVRSAKATARNSLVGGLALGTAAGFGLGGILSGSASRYNELQEARQIGLMSGDDLRSYAMAANQVGISVDKIADLRKDLLDRLGDYQITGGGEGKPIFEMMLANGYKMEDLQRLATTNTMKFYEELQKVFKASSINAAQQTFLLESLVDDGSQVMKLVEEAGKIKAIRGSLGLGMTAEDEKALGTAAFKTRLFTDAVGQLGDSLTIGFFSGAAWQDSIKFITSNKDTFREIGEWLGKFFNSLLKTFTGLFNALKELNPEVVATGVAALIGGKMATSLLPDFDWKAGAGVAAGGAAAAGGGWLGKALNGAKNLMLKAPKLGAVARGLGPQAVLTALGAAQTYSPSNIAQTYTNAPNAWIEAQKAAHRQSPYQPVAISVDVNASPLLDVRIKDISTGQAVQVLNNEINSISGNLVQ